MSFTESMQALRIQRLEECLRRTYHAVNAVLTDEKSGKGVDESQLYEILEDIDGHCVFPDGPRLPGV
jgi:hypothetical protein